MKASLIVNAVLMAAVAFLIFNQRTLNTQLETEAQRYQDSLMGYADSLEHSRDSLAYYLIVSRANNDLFHTKFDEAAAWYAMADSLGLGAFKWSTMAQDFVASQNDLQITAYRLRQQIGELERSIALQEGKMGELEEEVRAKAIEAEALKDKLLETVFSLNKAILANQKLEAQVQEAKSAHGLLNFLNTEGKSITYYGQIADGQANGFGIGVIAQKSFYEGEWKNNLRHGNGKYTWSNGDVYEGEFVQGKRNGYGVYLFASGEKYAGEWKNDVREGQGIMYSKDGKVLLDGLWVNDKYKKES